MRQQLIIAIFAASALAHQEGKWAKKDHHGFKNITRVWKNHPKFTTCALSTEEDNGNCVSECQKNGGYLTKIGQGDKKAMIKGQEFVGFICIP